MTQPGTSDSSSAHFLDLLKRYFGYDSFRPLQEQIIRDCMSGRDVFALLPTGGGKSLCYQLPAVGRTGLTVVVSPLIALMKDQVDSLQEAGVSATFLNSSMDERAARTCLAKLYDHQYRLLYVSPERLALPDFIERLKEWNVEQFAIDEAHCISEWGHDFRPEYRQLQTLRDHFPGVPFMALTATATERVRADIIKHLKLKDPGIYVASFNRPNLTYRVWSKESAYEQLVNFIRKRPGECGIVYSLSRKSTEDNAERLRKDGIKAVPYHAGLEQKERARNQELFLRDEAKVVCATIAFGMGINKPNVRFVVHYDMPKNIEGYYQETGRAGRDGLPSECLLLFSPGDVAKLMRFIEDMPSAAEQQNARKQLNQMVHYAECSTCRRAALLHYFAETYPDPDCESCDNCLAPRPSYDGTIDAQKFLSCVFRIKSRGFGTGMKHVIDVLLGANTENIRKWGHDALTTYGIGKEHDSSEWQRIGRELLRLGLCVQAPGKFPTLELTAAGSAALTQRRTITLTKPPVAQEKAAKHTGEILCDEALFEKLRELRKKIADERNVPAYVVFNDSTLRLMAQSYPTTEADFARISGVGEKKRKEFGDAFIRAILDHLISNPKQVFAAAAPVNAVPTGLNDTTILTLKMFEKGQSVADIATARALTRGVVYKHLCTAVEAGAQIDPSSIASPEELTRIQAAFNAHFDGALKPVYEALGGKIEYGQLQLFRAVMPGGSRATQHSKEEFAKRKAEIQSQYAKAYTPWADDEDKRLLQLYAMKKSVDEIGQMLQRQPTAVDIRYRVLTDPAAAAVGFRQANAAPPPVKSVEEEGEFDQALFEKLKTLRRTLAASQNVPAFIIFSDAVLKRLARECPTDSAAFMRVKGIGEKKAAELGEAFIAEIQQHQGTGVKPSSPRETGTSVSVPAKPAAGWSADDDMLLQALAKSGKKLEQLAIIMQRPAGVVGERMKALGLK